jgi:hypothetical protein
MPSKEEVTVLLGELAESLKPSVLVLLDQIKLGAPDRDSNLAKYKHNAATLDKWLSENIKDQDFYTLKNLRRAVSATKVSLYWVAAPKVRGANGVQDESKGRPAKREQGFADATATRKIIQDAANKQAAERDASILRSAEAFCKSHTSHPHSRTFKERAELQAEFKRLVARKVKPSEIDKQVRALANSFFKDR